MNNKPSKQYIFPPTAQEMFNDDQEAKEKMDQIQLVPLHHNYREAEQIY